MKDKVNIFYKKTEKNELEDYRRHIESLGRRTFLKLDSILDKYEISKNNYNNIADFLLPEEYLNKKDILSKLEFFLKGIESKIDDYEKVNDSLETELDIEIYIKNIIKSVLIYINFILNEESQNFNLTYSLYNLNNKLLLLLKLIKFNTFKLQYLENKVGANNYSIQRVSVYQINHLLSSQNIEEREFALSYWEYLTSDSLYIDRDKENISIQKNYDQIEYLLKNQFVEYHNKIFKKLSSLNLFEFNEKNINFVNYLEIDPDDFIVLIRFLQNLEEKIDVYLNSQMEDNYTFQGTGGKSLKEVFSSLVHYFAEFIHKEYFYRLSIIEYQECIIDIQKTYINIKFHDFQEQILREHSKKFGRIIRNATPFLLYSLYKGKTVVLKDIVESPEDLILWQELAEEWNHFLFSDRLFYQYQSNYKSTKRKHLNIKTIMQLHLVVNNIKNRSKEIFKILNDRFYKHKNEKLVDLKDYFDGSNQDVLFDFFVKVWPPRYGGVSSVTKWIITLNTTLLIESSSKREEYLSKTLLNLSRDILEDKIENWEHRSAFDPLVIKKLYKEVDNIFLELNIFKHRSASVNNSKFIQDVFGNSENQYNLFYLFNKIFYTDSNNFFTVLIYLRNTLGYFKALNTDKEIRKRFEIILDDLLNVNIDEFINVKNINELLEISEINSVENNPDFQEKVFKVKDKIEKIARELLVSIYLYLKSYNDNLFLNDEFIDKIISKYLKLFVPQFDIYPLEDGKRYVIVFNMPRVLKQYWWKGEDKRKEEDKKLSESDMSIPWGNIRSSISMLYIALLEGTFRTKKRINPKKLHTDEYYYVFLVTEE